MLKDLKSIQSKDERYCIRIGGFIWSAFPRKPKIALCQSTVSWENVNSKRLYVKLYLEMKILIFPKYIIIARYILCTFIPECKRFMQNKTLLIRFILLDESNNSEIYNGIFILWLIALKLSIFYVAKIYDVLDLLPICQRVRLLFIAVDRLLITP